MPKTVAKGTPSVWRGRILAKLFVCLMFEKSCDIHNCLNRVIVKFLRTELSGVRSIVYLFDSNLLTIGTCFAFLKPKPLRPEPFTYMYIHIFIQDKKIKKTYERLVTNKFQWAARSPPATSLCRWVRECVVSNVVSVPKWEPQNTGQHLWAYLTVTF